MEKGKEENFIELPLNYIDDFGNTVSLPAANSCPRQSVPSNPSEV